ncbi:HNH endonuclease signature motif containing protein, partial [Arthrobacter sp. PsM3]|uniref:HNH endonuclease signature motif containing protein n=1 Tax=Arthrobacter sp. PsM3 TaxID=3030531 RepID=UPI00263B148D
SLAESLLPRQGFTGGPLPSVHGELGAAVASGEIASRPATIITLALDRVRHVCDAGAAARMEHALTRTAAENDTDFLTRVARSWTDALDQDGAEPSEELLRQLQGAFLRKPRHGLQHLEIFGTAEQFEHLLTVMNTATNPRTPAPEPGTDAAPAGTTLATGVPAAGICAGGVAGGPVPWAEGGPDRAEVPLDLRSRPQKLLDGLVSACKAALAAGTLPAAGGLRPQVRVTIDYRDLLARLGHADGDPQNTGGPFHPGDTTEHTGNLLFTGPVTASTVRKIACDADIIPVLLGSEGRVLDIGRASRVFPPHIRKALTARDQGCTFPGCTIPAPWCEAHHITYWSRGGTTGTDNGALLCSHHHHVIHKEQWSIQIRHGIPWFIPPPHLDPRQKPRRNHYFRPTDPDTPV